MGCHHSIRHDKFPKQGRFNGRRVVVCFHYDLDHTFPGTICRDDDEEPLRTIIQLDDGRVVLSDECQWSIQPQVEQHETSVTLDVDDISVCVAHEMRRQGHFQGVGDLVTRWLIDAENGQLVVRSATFTESKNGLAFAERLKKT